MPLEIIGPGFGRTGTNSLKLALERLGFGPCHHMHEVAGHPERVPLWERAAAGLTVDWEAVFRGYQAQLDWPGARFWRELSRAYAAARVILTVRPAAEWFRSFEATILPELAREPDDPPGRARRRMQRRIIAEQTFGGRMDDRAHAIAVFEAHVAAVRRALPPERLLVYEVSSGWAPLCRFLGVPAPDAPFPATNSPAEFHAKTWVIPTASLFDSAGDSQIG